MAKKLVVQKYGGSSVANSERVVNVAKRIISYKKSGYNVVVVVSARGDTTDELIGLAQSITDSPPVREMDMLMATGEQISMALLAMAIDKLGQRAISLTGAQCGIITDRTFTKAKIKNINAKRIFDQLKKNKIVIVAGFQGMTRDAEITTLGRGGSDLTAVALAEALNADVCEIYTDVDGIYTTDPRIVPEAKKLNYISYDEMLELASLGAQVMQARSIQVAKKYNIPLHVRSSFNTNIGTIICKEAKSMEDVVVTGVAVNKDEAKVTICDVPDKPGIAADIFEEISRGDINVDMIVQNISRTGYTDVSFTVVKTDLSKTMSIAKKVSKEIGAGDVLKDEDIAKVSIVGLGMRSHSGIAARMFRILATKRINIGMITTSEIKISCIIKKEKAAEAVKALHKEFGLEKIKR